MKQIAFIIFLVIAYQLSVFAQLPTPIIVQVQQSDKDVFDKILFAIQVLTLLALIAYVYKTWQIASASKTSAETSQSLIEISQKSIELSQGVLEEMKASRIQENSPYVIAYFDMPYGNSWTLFLVVKNLGKTAAKDVKLEFNPPLQTGWGNKISNFVLPFIKDGISSLAPAQEIRTPFDAITNYFNPKMVERLNGKLPIKYNITVSYSSFLEEKRINTEQKIDLSMFKDLAFLEQKGEQDLIKAIEVIADNSKRINKSFEELLRKTVDK